MVKTADELIKSMDDAYTQLRKGKISFPEFEELLRPLESYYEDQRQIQVKRLEEYHAYQKKHPCFYQSDGCACYSGGGYGNGCHCRLAFCAEDKYGITPGGDSQYLLDIIDAEKKRFVLLKNKHINGYRGYLWILQEAARTSPLAKVFYEDMNEQNQNKKKRKIEQCSDYANTMRKQMRSEAKALMEITALWEKAEEQLEELTRDL